MKLSISAAILCVLLVVLLPGATYARSVDWIISRPKRLSDQRLAEIETLLALQNVKGVAVPVGYGKIDPAILGRRRRFISGDDLELQRPNTKMTVDQPDQSRPLPWQQDPQGVQRNY